LNICIPADILRFISDHPMAVLDAPKSMHRGHPDRVLEGEVPHICTTQAIMIVLVPECGLFVLAHHRHHIAICILP
jgi:hypothetical protein